MSKGLHAVKPATEVVEFTKEHLVLLLEKVELFAKMVEKISEVRPLVSYVEP